MQALAQHAKFKQRPHETSRDRHLPELRGHPGGPSVVLLGDSMIERMITTGLSPSFQPWPSQTMVSDDIIADSSIQTVPPTMRRLHGVFNAGVGGDRFEHVIYRLVGSPDPSRPLDSLLDTLRQRPVKLWVLHVGTNNLHVKRGMSEADLGLLRLIIEALLEAGGRVLLVGLFRRRDVADGLVARANEAYRSIAREQEAESLRVEFLAPPEVDMDECLVDHVHLNEKGYRIWAEVLLRKVSEMMEDRS